MTEREKILIMVKGFLMGLGIKTTGYTLINNYGITFEYKGHKFDMRYWANCYGTALNLWKIRNYIITIDITLQNFTDLLDAYIEKYLSDKEVK